MTQPADRLGVRNTDITVCSFLTPCDTKKGGLSKFIDDAVRWRVLDQTRAELVLL